MFSFEPIFKFSPSSQTYMCQNHSKSSNVARLVEEADIANPKPSHTKSISTIIAPKAFQPSSQSSRIDPLEQERPPPWPPSRCIELSSALNHLIPFLCLVFSFGVLFFSSHAGPGTAVRAAVASGLGDVASALLLPLESPGPLEGTRWPGGERREVGRPRPGVGAQGKWS